MQTIVGIGFIVSLLSELAVATYSSLKKSNLAFIAPRILNSPIVSFASNLDMLVQTGKKEAIYEKANNYNWKILPKTQKIEDLQAVENFLIHEYEETYDKFLFFLPENLLDFFEEWKILRDFENLKTLLACITNSIQPDYCTHLFGPQGKISLEKLNQLSTSLNVSNVLDQAIAYFPPATISEIKVNDEDTLDKIRSSIDRVAAGYLSGIFQKVKIEGSDEIQKLVMKKYEIKDLVTIARLKEYGIASKTITSLITCQQAKLTEREIENLVSAKNYKIFYWLLSKTYYGKLIPKETVSPRELEQVLHRSFFKELTKPTNDIGEKLVIQFMISLEYCFPIIWKAIIFYFMQKGEDKQ